eukprot:gnl/TRDRNA2_/TRDRNA2_157808_c2_seq4.p1 gnl/TRDRNA2_/TRDRNA2_157808_c2~~gnl/TRDRNA2_/TRDRNA2_157808_c2_seq4.p1  ORF type:complete len:254 (+),score=59.93 gnl/TRDRNA2_/TRDRNA2_157808_c2_seq4:90-851(+)
MKSLTALGLASNQLQVLPTWLGELRALTELNLRDNRRLVDLPRSLSCLKKLQSFTLQGTPLAAAVEKTEDHPLQADLYKMAEWGCLRLLSLSSSQRGATPEALPRWRHFAVETEPRDDGFYSGEHRGDHAGGHKNARAGEERSGAGSGFSPPPRSKPAAAKALFVPSPKYCMRCHGTSSACKACDADAGRVLAELQERIEAARDGDPEARHRLLRELFLLWHPDKQPDNVELATRIFQWLQEVRNAWEGTTSI